MYVVDMDLEKFFDTVCQSKLIEVLSRTIKDGRVISLIHKYLNAGVIANGKFERTEVGMPQGGPLSPLLSNIMLNELDKELERRLKIVASGERLTDQDAEYFDWEEYGSLEMQRIYFSEIIKREAKTT